MLPFNPTLRLTAGLANTYRAVGAKQSLPRHETTADGRLVLTPETPLLAHRYRFMHVLVESDLSQMICAVDTYRNCEPTAEGRRQPLVAIKVLNARHWALGAQEHERVRRLRGGLNGWKRAGLPVEGDARTMFAGQHFSPDAMLGHSMAGMHLGR